MNSEALRDQWWYGYAVGFICGMMLVAFSGCVVDNLIDPKGATYQESWRVEEDKLEVI